MKRDETPDQVALAVMQSRDQRRCDGGDDRGPLMSTSGAA
jgi:hypothetical protein